MTTLSDGDLREIRRLSARTHLALARRFGITPEAVDAIVRGSPWQHLVKNGDAGLIGAARGQPLQR